MASSEFRFMYIFFARCDLVLGLDRNIYSHTHETLQIDSLKT